MPEGRWPRGVTPRPRSGAGAECQTATAQDRLRGATQRPRSGAATRGVTPHPRSGAAAGRSNPMSEARGGGQEDQPHVQGPVAAWAQEGLEELSHVEGQEGQR